MLGCDFYFSEVYVPFGGQVNQVTSFENIVGKAKNALLERSLELTDVSMIIRYKKNEWEIKADSLNNVNELSERVLQSGELVISGFRSEEIEELHSYGHSVIEHHYQ